MKPGPRFTESYLLFFGGRGGGGGGYQGFYYIISTFKPVVSKVVKTASSRTKMDLS